MPGDERSRDRVAMAKREKGAREAKATAATVGYEAPFWQMADALRGSMDAAEYEHVVLGLIFLARPGQVRSQPSIGRLRALRRLPGRRQVN